MWTRILIFFGGCAAGFSGAYLMPTKQPAPDRMLRLERDSLVQTSMDAVDALANGEVLGAQLLLASAVNGESQAIFRQSTSTAQELASARSWQARMRSHNERLQLTPAREVPRD